MKDLQDIPHTSLQHWCGCARGVVQNMVPVLQDAHKNRRVMQGF